MSILDDTALHSSCLYLMLTNLNEFNESTQDFLYLRFFDISSETPYTVGS